MNFSELRDYKNAIRRLESASKVTGSAEYLDDLEMQGLRTGILSVARIPMRRSCRSTYLRQKSCRAY